MSEQVGRALFNGLDDHGIAPDFDTLPARYEAAAETLIDQYAADATFNGLDYDRSSERAQVASYADAVLPPECDTRLPPWEDAPLDPEDVARAAADAVDRLAE
jgi:glucosyl-3-phosphoglycerate synthase